MENEKSEEDQDLKGVSSDSDMLADFERAIATQDQQEYYLRLYIAGTTPRSTKAIKNLKLICETYLKGRYELEVIDVYQSTQEMQPDNIIALPTLIKRLPLPLRRMIGDLSDSEKVLLGLDIVPK
jgi:circadian clock protein KaiB